MIEEKTTDKLNATCERLKYLRSLTRLDRKVFSEKYDIPEITLRLWENNKAPVSLKGINRCIQAYQQEGINVTAQWLQNGIGEAPKLDHALISFVKNIPLASTIIKSHIEKDYQYFSELYPDCIFFRINGNEMGPTYKIGDFVMGRISHADIKTLNTKDCIVHLSTGEVAFRRIFITKQDQVNLNVINPFSQCESILNAQIKTIAPIMLHYII